MEAGCPLASGERRWIVRQLWTEGPQRSTVPVRDEDLYPAVSACPDIASFSQAATEHPDVLGDTEPEAWLAVACDEAQDESVSGSTLCAEVAGDAADDPGDDEDAPDDGASDGDA
jgi:hypothetical protein